MVRCSDRIYISSTRADYNWGRLQPRAVTTEGGYNRGQLQLRAVTTEGGYNWGRLQLRAVTTEGGYNWGQEKNDQLLGKHSMQVICKYISKHVMFSTTLYVLIDFKHLYE